MRIKSYLDIAKLKDADGKTHYLNKDHVEFISQGKGEIIYIYFDSGDILTIDFETPHGKLVFCRDFYKEESTDVRNFTSVKAVYHHPVADKQVVGSKLGVNVKDSSHIIWEDDLNEASLRA